jgi:protoporphyrinogen oxidase
MNNKIIIIGAGPAGLSAAYAISKKGRFVEIFEKAEFVGGMARSIDIWGQRVDLGPHRFFSNNVDVNIFFTELIKDEFILIDRQTRIFYQKHFFDYPLKLINVFKNLPISTIISVIYYYLIQKINPIKNPKNFEEWITDRFGKKLFQIFFKNYSEKLWGIKCSKIDADWAAQRIKTLTLWETVLSSIKGNKGNKHKTLVDQFVYPLNGNGTIYEHCAQEIIKHSGKINFKSEVKKIILNTQGNAVVGIKLYNEEFIEGNTIISTMPINQLLMGIEDVPNSVMEACNSLFFRNTVLVYLEIDTVDLFSDNWIYVHDSTVKFGRITNFRNWSSSLNKNKKTTIICLEYWCFDHDELWGFDDSKIIEIAENDYYESDIFLIKYSILNTRVLKIPNCYPVYETGYKKHLNIIVKYLRNINGLHLIGRSGSFKYNNQDHSILMGLLASEIIVENRNIDLWEINTDSNYQEISEIQDVFKTDLLNKN